uniref:Uncharacterized protein n=1 Tax=Nelumbo nucifera TaxID=4432 RepID=A0A822YT30_NELNU|nr:TPA_asm: hypothetical protein HUJ06_006317 [Nelumbo nucifera]
MRVSSFTCLSASMLPNKPKLNSLIGCQRLVKHNQTSSLTGRDSATKSVCRSRWMICLSSRGRLWFKSGLLGIPIELQIFILKPHGLYNHDVSVSLGPDGELRYPS